MLSKENTGTTLGMGLKIFDGNDLPHELFLQTKLSSASLNINM